MTNEEKPSDLAKRIAALIPVNGISPKASQCPPSYKSIYDENAGEKTVGELIKERMGADAKVVISVPHGTPKSLVRALVKAILNFRIKVA